MASSLEELAKNLHPRAPPEDPDEIPAAFKLLEDFITSTYGRSSRKTKMLLQKGIFPYSYLDHPDKLNETSLPPREAFFNELTQEECSEEDYNFAHEVWNEFGMATFGDYTELYCKQGNRDIDNHAWLFVCKCLKMMDA